MKTLRVLAISLLFIPGLLAAQVATPRSAAIIVINRAGPEFDDKIPVVEDLITAKVSELGLSIVSPDIVINAARALNPEAATALRPTDSLESTLADSASVVRLAQGLNTDYILTASILGFNEQKKEIKAYDNQLTNYTYTLRIAYKLLDAQTGGSLSGGLAKAIRTEQNTIHVNTGVIESAGSAKGSTAPVARPARRSAYSADEGLVNSVRNYEKAVALVAFALQDGRLVGNGTAWAIGPNTFATNAHVSQPVAEVLAKGGAAYVVLNKDSGQKFRINKAITHPRYQSAPRAADGREAFGLSYDVGLLKIDGETDVWFPVAPAEELRKVDSGYRIAFLGFPMEGLVGGGVNVNNPVATMQSGIITANTDWWMGKGDYDTRLLIQHNLGSTGGASGSPIFNPQGEVIALLNAGNMIGQVIMTSEGPSVTRAPSAALVNFGQRVDMLSDLLGTSGGGDTRPAGHKPHNMPAAPEAPVKPHVTFIDPDASAFIDDLLDDATDQIAQALGTSLSSGRIAAPTAVSADQNVKITLDVQITGVQPPTVSLGKDSMLTTTPAKITPEKVNVEIDGVSVGTAPGTITVRKGFSQIRLTHPSLKTWQRTINAVDGQTLTASLSITDESLQQWKDYSDYLYSLEKDKKLTDAQVEVLKGKAQSLRQSGFKVDTAEAPKVKNKDITIIK